MLGGEFIKSVFALLDEKDVARMGERLNEQHPKYKLLWDLGIATGLRISDLVPLRVKCVLTGVINLTETKTRKNTSKHLTPQINESVRVYIARYGLRRVDFLFFPGRNCRAGLHIHRNSAYKAIRKAALYLGLDGIGTHSMRKTHAVNKYRETNDLEAVRRALNHKYTSTTIGYLISDKDVKNLLRGVL
jgi:integrase